MCEGGWVMQRRGCDIGCVVSCVRRCTVAGGMGDGNGRLLV